MIYTLTAWILQPGKVDTMNELLKDVPALWEKAGGKFVGAWRTTTGNMYEVTTMLAFENMEQRDKSMAAISQNKEFMALSRKREAMLVSATSKLMTPLPMSPLK